MTLLFGVALANPITMYVESPTPVQVLVDGELVGSAWLDKTHQVRLSEGQTLRLHCGSEKLEPPAYTRGPLEIRVRNVKGPCRIGSSGEPRVASIIGVLPGGVDRDPVADIWGKEPGLHDLAAVMVEQPDEPKVAPPNLSVKALECEGCDDEAGQTLRKQVRRYLGQLKYCAERNEVREGTFDIVLSHDGTLTRAEVNGPSEPAVACMQGKIARWRLPAEAPKKTRWTVVFDTRE